MTWLLMGFAFGVIFTLFLQWSRANHVHTGILFWLLTLLALVSLLSGVQNFYGLREELEEAAAMRIIPIYGVQVLVWGTLAALLLWRNARRARRLRA
jgi:hypothetical protein